MGIISFINLSLDSLLFLVYILSSILYNKKIKLVTKLKEKIPKTNSISFLYSSAIWFEREVWDFFGIYFLGNPDLRRLLTDYGYLGFPLRKDYPLTGFYDLFYDDLNCKILKRPINLNSIHKNLKRKNGKFV